MKTYPTLFILAFLLTAFLPGCSGPLNIRYEPKPQDSLKAARPVSIAVAPFKDSRDLSGSAFNDPRTIGRLASTVADMSGEAITISEDIPALVRRAYEKELALAGYDVRKDANADFIITGEVTRFTLNVGARDEIGIGLKASIKEAETGKEVWSGEPNETDGRFAGVMGNTRATLSSYIAGSLSKAIRASIAEAGPVIANTKSAYMPPGAAQRAAPLPEGTGRLSVSASPARSRVYINEVYYGITPVSFDLEPGVYDVEVKQKGFRSAREKVSVRKGQFTGLETELEKE